jgi:hypothetical protein
MRKLVFLFSMLVGATGLLHAQLPPQDPMFDSVFVENFNGTTLDTSKWTAFYPFGNSAAANFFDKDTIHTFCGVLDIAQIKRDTSNRTISSGTCKLIGKKEHSSSTTWTYYPYPSTECTTLGLGPVPWGSPTDQHCLDIDTINFKYTNALISTRSKYKYGYFEMAFRIPGWSASQYNTFSPTFWMYNANSTRPWSEIDIMEINGRNGLYQVNVHVDAVANDGPIFGGYDFMTPGTEPSIDLNRNVPNKNKAAAYWTPDYIDFYLNDLFIYRSNNLHDTNQYLMEMPIIIENAMSASNQFCGNLDSVFTQFPITYEIDYVKVYQPKLACDTDKVYTNVTAATFNSKLYKSLTIAGPGYSAIFNNGIATAKGTDYVLLKEGFEVGTNMNMLIDTEPCWSGMQAVPPAPGPAVPFDSNILEYKARKGRSY